MSLTFALIITSCTFNHTYCVQYKTYHPTEQECGVASASVKARLVELKPKAKVIYFCIEQEAPLTGPSLATPSTVLEAMETLRLASPHDGTSDTQD